jgi:hypothetical protein
MPLGPDNWLFQVIDTTGTLFNMYLRFGRSLHCLSASDFFAPASIFHFPDPISVTNLARSVSIAVFMIKTLRAVKFLFVGPLILALLVVINVVTSPGHWWVQ